jgi:hypothetical protein
MKIAIVGDIHGNIGAYLHTLPKGCGWEVVARDYFFRLFCIVFFGLECRLGGFGND